MKKICLRKCCVKNLEHNGKCIREHFWPEASIEEIREAAARLCKDYLTGRWKDVKADELIVKRISGGLSNFLYYIGLPDVDDSLKEAISSPPTSDNAANSINNNNNINDDSGMANDTSCVSESDLSFREFSCVDKNSIDTAGAAHGDQRNSTISFLDNNNDTNNKITVSKKRQRTESGGSSASSLSLRHRGNVDEPQQVLLRIYGQTHGGDALEFMITESVVFALLSERNLGPKLHGIFPGGRIEQYIPARPLLTLELSDSKISMRIAAKMGEIHSMNIPMSKEPTWLWNSMERWLLSVNNILRNLNRFKNINQTYLDKVRKFDFTGETNWMRSVIEAENYMVLFCHNDLQEGNILLKENNCKSAKRRCISSLSTSTHFDESISNMSLDDVHTDVSNVSAGMQKKTSKIQRSEIELENTCDSAWSAYSVEDDCPNLIIIDFEYCAYNYRGFDIANHFVEWSLDYTNPEFPYFYHRKHQYPNANQRRNFIAAYLSKLNEDIEDYEPTNEEIDGVEEEVRRFTMLSHLFWTLWSIVNVESNIQFGYWEYAISRMTEYEALKRQYLLESKLEKANLKLQQ